MLAKKEFLMKFASKLVIFDPMDRAIPNEDENCATPREELNRIINDMAPSTSVICNVPMSNQLHEKIQKHHFPGGIRKQKAAFLEGIPEAYLL